jgi:hypothetical protein
MVFVTLAAQVADKRHAHARTHYYFSSATTVMVPRMLSSFLIFPEIVFLSSSSELDSSFTMISWYLINLYAYATAGIFLSSCITTSSVPIEQSMSMIAIGKVDRLPIILYRFRMI